MIIEILECGTYFIYSFHRQFKAISKYIVIVQNHFPNTDVGLKILTNCGWCIVKGILRRGNEFSHRNFPLAIFHCMHPVPSPRHKIIIRTHEMPGLPSCIIPLNAIHVDTKRNIVQSDSPIISCEGWVAYHVPAWMEDYCLVLDNLDSVVFEIYSTGISNIYP